MKTLRTLYFSFFQSHINYAASAWASTNSSNLETIFKKQKHALRIIFNVDKLTHSKPLFEKLKVLNIYQLNIYQILILMFKINNKEIVKTVSKKFNKVQNIYCTRSSNILFQIQRSKSKKTNFKIAYRGPKL